MAATLYDLKAGDEVVIAHHGGGETRYVRWTVSRTTTTQVITRQNGMDFRWRKKNGRRVGAEKLGYSWPELALPTEKIRATIAETELREAIYAFMRKFGDTPNALDDYPVSALQDIWNQCEMIAAIRETWKSCDAN